MEDDTPAELLRQLLDACDEGRSDAIRLAQRTEIEALRTFLQDSAQQYRSALEDIRTSFDEGLAAHARLHDDDDTGFADDEDVAASWERAECEALTYFRDVYDMPLPPRVADAVKRHYEAGVERLERLRQLQARLNGRRAS